jgi:hypothetical protein
MKVNKQEAAEAVAVAAAAMVEAVLAERADAEEIRSRVASGKSGYLVTFSTLKGRVVVFEETRKEQESWLAYCAVDPVKCSGLIQSAS